MSTDEEGETTALPMITDSGAAAAMVAMLELLKEQQKAMMQLLEWQQGDLEHYR